MISKELTYEESIVLATISNAEHIGLKGIQDKTGIDTRTTKRLVQSLRRKGYPICSNTSVGYWLSNSPEDINHTLRNLRSRIKELEETCFALELTRDKEMISGKLL